MARYKTPIQKFGHHNPIYHPTTIFQSKQLLTLFPIYHFPRFSFSDKRAENVILSIFPSWHSWSTGDSSHSVFLTTTFFCGFFLFISIALNKYTIWLGESGWQYILKLWYHKHIFFNVFIFLCNIILNSFLTNFCFLDELTGNPFLPPRWHRNWIHIPLPRDHW